MNLLEGMLKKQTVTNTKGGQYYSTTYNSNLDLFSGISRHTDTEHMKLIFRNAFNEDKVLAVANLLYYLDIREGKGERKIFKELFEELCSLDKYFAILVLNQIGELGRWDYVLVGLKTSIKDETLKLIKSQIQLDIEAEKPSLLGKWLPSLRTHNKNNLEAFNLIKMLGLREKEYRNILSTLRNKIGIIEHNLTNKNYDNIEFAKIPTKAILKYRKALEEKCGERYKEYVGKADKGEVKVNTKGLFCYEIIEKIMKNLYYDISDSDKKLFNAMWEQQKDIFEGIDTNILVMADTSGSMSGYEHAIETSIGLALYIAERNHGIFKDYYMTFSSTPLLQKVTGINIFDKVQNIKTIIQNTDIDKAFQLLLNTSVENSISQEDMPSHIIIISDMEFDYGVYSKGGTNFYGWKKAFEEKGYKLPQVIFWNVNTVGFPVTKFDKDVCMINGFSTNALANLLDTEALKELTPISAMINSLKKYIEIIEKGV